MEFENAGSQRENVMTDSIETARSIKCQMCGVVNWPTAPACMGCNAPLEIRTGQELIGRPIGSKMSFSQKVARFFEIADYLLLLPAIYGLFLSLGLIGMAPWFTLIVVTSFIAGCWLLSGFIRHSRGRLSEAKVKRLWYATMAYNFIELASLWVLNSSSRKGEAFLFSLWPLLVVLLSATALWSEGQKPKFFYD